MNEFSKEVLRCRLCGGIGIDLVKGYESLLRVTSDERPWRRGGKLCVCPNCGCVQKVADEAWKKEVEQIYKSYSIYRQGNGAEQSVFDVVSGRPSLRSALLLDRLKSKIKVPQKGRLLDIGCANGSFLKAFNEVMPSWSLVGTELNDKYRSVIEKLNSVEAFFTCSPSQVPGHFDMVTMIHVLEHTSDPKGFLSAIWQKLLPGGILVVEVPNYFENPFDLLNADHCIHYTSSLAQILMQEQGFEVLYASTDWIPKELTLVARKTEAKQTNQIYTDAAKNIYPSAQMNIRWLKSVVNHVRQLSKTNQFGIFGSSIAATWLCGELEGCASFFVDEDPNRIGKSHLGLPIYHPREVPEDSHVYIILHPAIAGNIKLRIESSGVKFHCHVPPLLSHNQDNAQPKTA